MQAAAALTTPESQPPPLLNIAIAISSMLYLLSFNDGIV
jgi:hypothetical protein